MLSFFLSICRRPLAVRERCIYSMTPAERTDSHHFNLFLKTQAGTYPLSLNIIKSYSAKASAISPDT